MHHPQTRDSQHAGLNILRTSYLLLEPKPPRFLLSLEGFSHLDVNDVGVANRMLAHHLRFSLKALKDDRIAIDQWDIDNDFITKLLVNRFLDLSHTALAKARQNLVAIVDNLVGFHIHFDLQLGRFFTRIKINVGVQERITPHLRSIKWL